MPKLSAGLLLYRKRQGVPEVFLVHPGGPFWKNKDEGAWSIPKGEINEGETPLEAARREFEEETGFAPPKGSYHAIGEVKLKSGKIIHGWAAEGEADPDAIVSIKFEVEWPPRSGKMKEFPEADRAGWFSLADARAKIHPGQSPFLDALEELFV